jgi:replicative DNA helicase
MIKPTADIAEKNLIACILCEPRALSLIAEIVQPDDFHGYNHRIVYEAMLELDADGQAIDYAAILSRIEGKADEAHVAALGDMVPDIANARGFACLVKDASTLRRLQAFAGGWIADSKKPDADAAELLGRAHADLCGLTDSHIRTTWREAYAIASDTESGLREAVSGGGRLLNAIPTGFAAIDRYLDGFRPGDLAYLAARPSQGKTALAMCMALNMARRGKKVAFFSLEMSDEQLVMRAIAALSGIPLYLLRSCCVAKQMGDISSAVAQLRRMALFIDAGARLTPMEARLKLRRLQQEHGVDIAFLDYIGLMNWHERLDSKYVEITEISHSLKAMAKEMRIPIVALSQLRRLPPGSKPQRPELSDLRDSGSLEQDADICIFIHRAEQYLLDRTPSEEQGKAEVLIAKHRNGPTGVARVAFQKDLCQFLDIERREYPIIHEGIGGNG